MPWRWTEGRVMVDPPEGTTLKELMQRMNIKMVKWFKHSFLEHIRVEIGRRILFSEKIGQKECGLVAGPIWGTEHNCFPNIARKIRCIDDRLRGSPG